ncbi:unnamed protein product [Kuraishia capsulata CBS 1993]|uniref:Altered inheritance of mitochondria protein 41 n=1 Tax=Kuraishia capsulata CBS 1993 TaxID=1382522 RepID=W6MNM9_9ASCO|nr:uncharacterized protein KUCA_T00004256001 [Kuraishia capsulata CBS 1993]CDK28274.1 unnamed protein product [Kuraishia capsulata CBS 1993]
MLTEIKNKEIDTPTKVHDEFDLYELFAKMIKQRQESAKEYMKVGNPDRFHQVGLNELREVDYIKKYIDALPVATDAEIDARVEKAAKLALEEGAKLEKISDLMAKIPWKSINSDWRASKTAVSASVQRVFKDL